MAQKPETVFKERIVPRLNKLPLVFVEKIQQKAKRGTLDLILSVNGWYVALELKVYGDLDPMQKRTIFRVKKSNGIALETTPENFEEVLKFIEALISHPHQMPATAMKLLNVLNQN